MSRRGWLLFAAMSVIWGVPYLLIRVAVRDVEPATVVFGRTAIASVILVPLAIRRGALRGLLPQWHWLAVYTLVEVAGPWLLLGTAEEHLTSSLTGLLVAMAPLVGLIVNRATGGDEVVDARRVLGLAIGFGGVAALVGLQVDHVDLAAVGLVAAVSVGYALGPLIVARRLAHLPGLGVSTVSLTGCALIYLPVVLLSHPGHLTAKSGAAVVTLGVVCTAAAFVVFFALIAQIGPSRALVITYVNPAVALLLGVVVLGEHLTTGLAVGFPLVLVGSVLASARRRDDRRTPGSVGDPEPVPPVVTSSVRAG